MFQKVSYCFQWFWILGFPYSLTLVAILQMKLFLLLRHIQDLQSPQL